MKLTRWIGAPTLAVAALVATAAPALAHVAIDPASAPKGSDAQISFVVPNESDTASTVTVDVQMPPDHPIASVDAKELPGWTAELKKGPLAKPIETDDGTVTEAVTEVIWTATGGGIAPGQYEDFSLAVGPLPTDTDSLTFKTLQTYSDGTVASWIQVPDATGAEPDHPAPTLALTAAVDDGASASSSSTGASSSSTTSSTTAAPSTTGKGDTDDDDKSGRPLAALALIVGIVAVALGGVALSRTRTRKGKGNGDGDGSASA